LHPLLNLHLPLPYCRFTQPHKRLVAIAIVVAIAMLLPLPLPLPLQLQLQLQLLLPLLFLLSSPKGTCFYLIVYGALERSRIVPLFALIRLYPFDHRYAVIRVHPRPSAVARRPVVS
jgi:hypothetical protein